MQYADITFEDFIISSHLRPTKELINDIYNFIDKIKNDREKIESIYKVIKSLSNE